MDTQSRRGRFLITGSAYADLDSSTWPGTGRVIRIDMYGLTPAELAGRIPPTPLLDRLAGGDLGEVTPPRVEVRLRDYLSMALASGVPEPALDLEPAQRTRWLDSYVDQLITRDVRDQTEQRDPVRMRRFFEAYALNTAGIVDQSTLVAAAGVSRTTGNAYEGLLHNLHIVETLPAWWSNRLKRLTKTGKRYLVDPALALAVLRLDLAGLMRDGAMVGRILDTFALAQLRAGLSRCVSRPRLYHLRQADGRHEVNIIIEYGGGRVIGVEVKATSAPTVSDARHLLWLKQELGDRFLAGLMLHTGTRPFPLTDGILAAPISCLWH